MSQLIENKRLQPALIAKDGDAKSIAVLLAHSSPKASEGSDQLEQLEAGDIGGGGGNPGTPRGTFALAVTGTAGSGSQTIQLSLTVQ